MDGVLADKPRLNATNQIESKILPCALIEPTALGTGASTTKKKREKRHIIIKQLRVNLPFSIIVCMYFYVRQRGYKLSQDCSVSCRDFQPSSSFSKRSWTVRTALFRSFLASVHSPSRLMTSSLSNDCNNNSPRRVCSSSKFAPLAPPFVVVASTSLAEVLSSDEMVARKVSREGTMS